MGAAIEMVVNRCTRGRMGFSERKRRTCSSGPWSSTKRTEAYHVVPPRVASDVSSRQISQGSRLPCRTKERVRAVLTASNPLQFVRIPCDSEKRLPSGSPGVC